MTSGAPVSHLPITEPGSTAARAVAMATALALALVVLVVPGARAQSDELIPTTLSVEQAGTWWTGSNEYALDVEVRGAAGEVVPSGLVTGEIDGFHPLRNAFGTARPLRAYPKGRPAPGTYPVTVRFGGNTSGYAPAEWSGTVTVTEGSISTRVTATASSRVDDGDGGPVDVRVTADSGMPEGLVELSSRDGVVDQKRIQNGVTRLQLPDDLPPGKHTLAVSFYGVDGYRTSHAEVPVEVVKDERPLKVWTVGGTWNIEQTFWKVAVDVPGAYRNGGKLSLYHGSKLSSASTPPNTRGPRSSS